MRRALAFCLSTRIRPRERQPSQLLLAFRRDRTIEQLVVLQIHLEERRPLGNLPGDQRLRQRVFDEPLQCAAQRTRPVAAVDERLLEDPALRIVAAR